MGEKRPAGKRRQALVVDAHPLRSAAGQEDTKDFRAGFGHPVIISRLFAFRGDTMANSACDPAQPGAPMD
jgi:hypothetical protein